MDESTSPHLNASLRELPYVDSTTIFESSVGMAPLLVT
jgi:hypothetical protein